MRITFYVAVLVLAMSGNLHAQPRDFLLSSGPQGAAFNDVGRIFCEVINSSNKDQLNCKARASTGSANNVNLLAIKGVDLGLAQGDVVWFAANGIEEWQGKPIRQLRTVMPLFYQAVTLVTLADSGIRTVADLKGRRVNLGNKGSGSRQNALDVLEWSGIDPERDMIASYELAPKGATMLLRREVDAYFITVGHPASAITETADAARIAFVPIDGNAIREAIRRKPYYSIGRLPDNIYPNVPGVNTIGVRAQLMTVDTQSEDTIFRVTGALMKNLDTLQKAHPVLQNLSQDGLIKQLMAPLHPGAAKYYHSAGLM